jgi:two-component system phosphate regulon sensor histidine kinase PhoR
VNRGFQSELERVLLYAAFCVLVGWLNGYLTWTLVIGGAGYMAWTLRQIYRLDIWLRDSDTLDPPDANGIWGDIFDSMLRLQNRQKREKSQLQAVLNRSQETTKALPDGVILLDKKGNIAWFNIAARRLLGLHEDDQDHPLQNYIRHPSFGRYYDSGEYQESIDLPSPHSQDIRLQYQLTAFGRGEKLLVVRDITRIYKLEQMRKDFVANVSHELRTPLTVIRGYLETLAMNPDLPDTMQRAFEQMDHQGKRMTSLINDLIVLSKLETDDDVSADQKIELLPLLNSVVADATALSGNGTLSDDKAHVFELICDEGLKLRGSQKELQSAFSNLVFNAVKYSPVGSAIQIKVSSNENGLNVAVNDEGPGIDPIHIPRLTERFYRVDDSRTSSTGGAGLGLSIVKHILLRHDARLGISSTLGRGSCFNCHFPSERVVR